MLGLLLFTSCSPESHACFYWLYLCAAVLAASRAARSPGPAAETERSAALHLMHWLVELAQPPALRAIICQEVLQPVVAIGGHLQQQQAAQPAAPAGTPAASAVAAYAQQREHLMQILHSVLPSTQPAHPNARRPLPAPAKEPPLQQQQSLLYWLLSIMLPLEASLVEVRPQPLLVAKLASMSSA